MKTIKTHKGVIRFIKGFGIKTAFLTNFIRYDMNGAHHLGIDVILKDGSQFGVYSNGELLN
ncbi:hypothetical protein PF596_09755 [Streptococcus thermophilus]|uniref:hypothetical protein n=1 Tax=Streptococcus thermophilus TaxID=1308 RepID=UPI0022EA9B9D|nr:hypothetical protein [Streptococcus thermophilus]MDA3774966.1 hypothetical protein [Streptococcus thermophilus]